MKCDLFNSYFPEQCTPLVNNSKLPSVLTVHTESLLESFYFSVDHIGDIIKKLDPFNYFLSNRKQRVLNGQHASWTDIKAGVRQGFILGPLLFLVYINDLTENLHSNLKLFADDTSLFRL